MEEEARKGKREKKGVDNLIILIQKTGQITLNVHFQFFSKNEIHWWHSFLCRPVACCCISSLQCVTP